MKYIAVACENWPYSHLRDVEDWLKDTFKSRIDESGDRLWYHDYQPMIQDLCMREDVYTLYCLR